MEEQQRLNQDYHFVTYDVAVLLWEFEFDEPCQAKFNKKKFQKNVLGDWYRHNSDEISEKFLAAPLHQQVQEWFRTKFFMDITIKYVCSANEVINMYGNINFMINQFQQPDIKVEAATYVSHNELLNLTYLKAFEILKEQKKKAEKDLVV